jgi:hypothetical protein
VSGGAPFAVLTARGFRVAAAFGLDFCRRQRSAAWFHVSFCFSARTQVIEVARCFYEYRNEIIRFT